MNQHPPDSLSLPRDIQQLQHRSPNGLSDVQAKVAHLNSLSGGGGGSPTPSSSSGTSAALQRAIIGREEAESSLAGVSDQLSEAQSRERSLLEELQSTKQRYSNDRDNLYRDLKKARKEAFSTSSALVDTKEELRESKAGIERLNNDIQLHQEERNSMMQESREQADRINILEEEVENFKEKVQSLNSVLLETREELNGSKAELKRLNDDVQLKQGEVNSAIQESAEQTDYINVLVKDVEIFKEKVQSLSSLLADTQEEMNHLNDDVQLKQGEVNNAIQESAERADHINVLQRELEDVKEKVQFLESQNSLANSDRSSGTQTSAKKRGGVKRSSSLSPFSDDGDPSGNTPPKRQRTSSEFATSKKDEDTVRFDSPNDKVLELQANLAWERRLRDEAVKTIEFMCIECQFKTCRCRMAEAEGRNYVYDSAYHNKIAQDYPSTPAIEVSLHSGSRSPNTEEAGATTSHPEAGEDLLIAFSPETGTFRTVPSPTRSSDKKTEKDLSVPQPSARSRNTRIDLLTQSPIKEAEDARHSRFEYAARHTVPIHNLHSPTPLSRSLDDSQPGPSLSPEGKWLSKSVSLEQPQTRKVPLRTDEDRSTSSFKTDMPIDREAALAQIRARRGRAQGNMRPASVAEGNVRSGEMGVTPVRSAKRIPGLHLKANSQNRLGDRRDVSAPTRLSRR